MRSQQFRLDHENRLFDMAEDPGQYQDISAERPEMHDQLVLAKTAWEEKVLSELPIIDERTFPLGHPDFKYTQIPARDGKPHGNIKRSNMYPNCSFFTNWISLEDKITWEVEVVESGDFEVVLYYTCPDEDVGASFELTFNQNTLAGKITEMHNPP